MGTIRNIMNTIQGLGTYTIQNGLVYFHSLLRSSLLYAGETYYNLTERNLRMLEGIEEDCLRKRLAETVVEAYFTWKLVSFQLVSK